MKTVLHSDFKEFLFSLKRHDVRFVVIGAHVLATLGGPRFSDDLDVFVEASGENACEERGRSCLFTGTAALGVGAAGGRQYIMVERLDGGCGPFSVEFEPCTTF